MTDNYKNHSQRFQRACNVIPGGVNSPVRAFGAVEGSPVFMQRSQGAYLWDMDEKKYIDYVGSWGPMILGHACPEVIEAVKKAADHGTSFGTVTETETLLAEKVIEIVPSVEKVRLVNSGTEATMSALRLARAFTGRDKVIKIAGCYHGHGDSFLVQAGSGAATLGIPNSPGVTRAVAADTLIAEFNDISSVEKLIEQYPGQIAALIVEPVMGNAGLILPEDNYLQFLRKITHDHGILLIFDEVMTGFRLSPAGAQHIYNVRPDLTTFGKIIGGGLPIGAFGGRGDIMEMVAPAGPVYQAGTLSGNPLAVAAGLTTLHLLTEEVYLKLEALSARLEAGIRLNFSKLSLPYQYQRIGSMACLFFTSNPVRNYTDATTCQADRFARYFHDMLDRGVYLPPSQFESCFISAAHSEADIDQTIDANFHALQAL